MFNFDFNDHKYNHIHFIGIGGVSMSGMAEILANKGYTVSGTDAKRSSITDHLESLGVKLHLGHSKKNIEGADLIIYTDAISTDNEELSAAFSSNSPTIDRATFLGALMQNYRESIAVSGTHGKTTTTSMMASITNHTKDFSPTILLGGLLDEIGGNIRLASNESIITEACEYRANILKYYPTTAIILNIDEDHLDYFRNIDHIVDTFIGYVKNIQEDGNLIINIDDENAEKIIENTNANIITFAIDKKADYMAEDIKLVNEEVHFILNYRDEEKWPVVLNVMGRHNIYNAMASMIAIHINGVAMEDIANYISFYTGVHRRLEFKGKVNDIKVIDDYAHHPTEIKTTLEALKNSLNRKGKTYCVFQPHTYTRTQILMQSFAKSFANVDEVIIMDIYAAREKNNGTVHSKDLVTAVNKESDNAKYIGSFEEVEDYLETNLQAGDTVITMGAGDVYLIGEKLLDNLKNSELKLKKSII